MCNLNITVNFVKKKRMSFDPSLIFPIPEATELLPLVVFAILWSLRMLHILFFHGRLAFRKPVPAGAASESFTLLMAVRNGYEEMKERLPRLLDLPYPSYEVLVVDDYSEDYTPMMLGMLRTQHKHLKITTLNQKTRHSEKMARNLGMKAASNDWVVMFSPVTDPPNPLWLPTIASAISQGNEMVVGYSNLYPRPDLKHKLVRAETFYQNIESMSFCINRMPFVVSEENVTFNKAAYFGAGGFAGELKERFLNMEVILNKTIRSGKVAILPIASLTLRREANNEETAISELYRRYYNLNKYLPLFTRVYMFISNFIYMLLLPALLGLLFLAPRLFIYALILVLLMLIIYGSLIYRIQRRLGEQKLFVTSLIYSLGSPYLKAMMRWRFLAQRVDRKWRK